ncbi:xylulokinase [Lederbergia citrea]|uniref:FGGY-family carbohydrate kinase n=1 Tax=Lederbergia citrea TaxID=2833581 RepID=A0A942UJC2_9BACI|nr:FGGY-family carbohydrate kinase [Lederbergia citrea]MBS4221735.1 FGGY-family carbohydrate kinase [Lederbergia citrea]
MGTYILAHDLGTTNHKCTVFCQDGEFIASSSCTYPTFYEKEGIAEQDPYHWWRNVVLTTKKVLSSISPSEIAVITFSGHMNGCLPIDAEGTPLYRSIIHADSRSSQFEHEVFQKIDEDNLYRLTGNRIDSHYTLMKMYWLRKREPDLFKKVAYFLQAKDYLAYKMTGTLGVTDYSDASLTGTLNLSKKVWEELIFSELDLDVKKMPDIVASTEVVGYVSQKAAYETGLLEGIPVVIGGGDGACATIGAGCVNKGEMYINLGTTAWVSKVTDLPFIDPKKRVFNLCDLNPKYYNVLGTMQTAGAAYEWAMKQFSTITDWSTLEVDLEFEQFEQQLKKVPAGSNGIMCHPYLLGERSPVWNDSIRGSFFGLSLANNRFDLVKVVLEGVSLSLASIAEILNDKQMVNEVKLIGGGARSKVLIEILSDVLQLSVQLNHKTSEATSLGAAIAGGVGIGMYSSFEEADHLIKKGERQDPHKERASLYQNRLSVFKTLYEQVKDIHIVS